MKNLKIVVLVMVLFTFGFDCFAQSGRIPLSEKSVVKDSAGVVYSYESWFAMIGKGEYKLQKVKDGGDEYLLTKRQQLSADGNQQIYGKYAMNFIGKKIKFSRMTDLDGEVYEDKFLRDKIVVLNFWFVKCGPCKQEIPELNLLYKKYKGQQNVVFLSFCLDEEPAVIDFLKVTPFYYKIIPSAKSFADDFNINGYPTNIVIDNGVVKFSQLGYGSKNIAGLQNVIQGLVNKSK